MVKEPTMQSVSVRTLTLMVLLLVAVIAHQYTACIPTARADAVWLAGDEPNEPTMPEPETA